MQWHGAVRLASTVPGTNAKRRSTDSKARGSSSRSLLVSSLGASRFRYKKFPSEAEARKFVADNINVAGSMPKPDVPTVKVGASLNNKSTPSTPDGTRKRKGNESWRSSPAKRSKPDPEVTDPEFIDAPVVYTDGACSKNGKAKARAGWGVYWGEDSEDNAFGPVYGTATNNRGELIAVEKALEKAIEKGLTKLVVKTDSNLLVQSINIWIHGWKRKGWKTATGSDVLNKDVLVKIDNLRQKLKVKFMHVRGHAGVDGNEKADKLARKGAAMYTKMG
ncbi:hypothetical protein L3Y34_001998 [Caenorhabditis briggsae]|uniref:Ribonuclease H1 n=1 Tax=Caenorhabditis briggsae TaxID=6238 RepID=A0AAE9IS31_CAEBR|nr:hypothetical protein L3Y34_001998 [Caenorhabditis briggsae]